jgi:hypothetical protein
LIRFAAVNGVVVVTAAAALDRLRPPLQPKTIASRWMMGWAWGRKVDEVERMIRRLRLSRFADMPINVVPWGAREAFPTPPLQRRGWRSALGHQGGLPHPLM